MHAHTRTCTHTHNLSVTHAHSCTRTQNTEIRTTTLVHAHVRYLQRHEQVVVVFEGRQEVDNERMSCCLQNVLLIDGVLHCRNVHVNDAEAESCRSHEE